MNKEVQRQIIKQRINILKERGKDNSKIVAKLERKCRALA